MILELGSAAILIRISKKKTLNPAKKVNRLPDCLSALAKAGANPELGPAPGP